MALLSQQLQRFLTSKINHSSGLLRPEKKNVIVSKDRIKCCSAIAIDSPTSLTGVTGLRWGSSKLQGLRDEMEDELVIVETESPDGFSFAAVLDGHGGFTSVQFLRDELYRECITALQGGALLNGKDFNTIKKALIEAFENIDKKLSNRLGMKEEEDDSGATATAMFVRNDVMFVAHIGDSSAVLSRSGKPEALTSPHRPYGSNRASLQEIKRIREAGGWINNGRICADIAVSRAFGDIRFKTKKNEMLKKGVEEGRWSEKFISRVQFKGDLLTARPDVFQVTFGSDAEFIVLASDGLWDYINSSEAVSFIRNQLRKHGNVQRACESLAQAALDQSSQDNISIVIADLGRTDWKNLPAERQNFIFELGQALATLGIVSLGIWVSSQLFV